MNKTLSFNKKSRISALLIALLSLFSIPLTATSLRAFAENQSIDFIDDQDGYYVSSSEQLSDFSGNQFTLYNLYPQGYAIYDNDQRFIEGSYRSYSPYIGFSEDKYYLGPSNYYVALSNGLWNIAEDRFMEEDEVTGTSYLLPSVTDEESHAVLTTATTRSSASITVGTHQDEYGFTCLDTDYFFRNMISVPYNTHGGTCALVSISILLTYFDTFYHKSFVSDENLLAVNLGDIALDEITETIKTHKPSVQPLQSLHELLFTDYKHTILGIGSEDDGYPMANAEIRKTIDDYIDGEPNPGLDKGYNYDSEDSAIINTHSRTRGLIDEGYPVIISMTKYNTSSLVNTNAYDDALSPNSTKNTSKEKYHSVVVYGYDNNDRFLVHYGFTNDSEIIISGATIYSYYALKFTGTHICSYNFYTSSSKLEGQTPTVDYYMCAGCGKIYDENKYPIN